MIAYKEACEQIGYDRKADCPIEPENVWFAYKGGESKKFATQQEAAKFSTNVEKVVSNKKEIDAWWKQRRRLEQKAVEIWEAALKEEYAGYVSEEVYNLCYDRAYDRGHSYGHEEVAIYVEEEIEYAKEILATVKNKEVTT